MCGPAESQYNALQIVMLLPGGGGSGQICTLDFSNSISAEYVFTGWLGSEPSPLQA